MITADQWADHASSAGADEKTAQAVSDAKASRRLWCRVVQEAIEDFLSVHTDNRIREKGRTWLFDQAEDDDFREVCKMAGLAPDQIREGVRRLAQEKELSCDLPNIAKPKCHNETVSDELKIDPEEHRQGGDAMSKSGEVKDLEKEKVKECFEHGYSLRETSRIVGVAVGTAKQYLGELEAARREPFKCTCGLVLTHNGRCAARRARYDKAKPAVKKDRSRKEPVATGDEIINLLDEEIGKIEQELANLRRAREIIFGRQ